MRERWDLVVVTNDIYTKEDQRLLTVAGALEPERIMGVETGGCPHTAIREDASINLEAVDRMLASSSPTPTSCSSRSGGDNLAATFSPRAERPHPLRDRRGRRREDPAQGRPPASPRATCSSSTRPTWRPMWVPTLAVMEADTRRMRPDHAGRRPYVMTNLKTRTGLADVVRFIEVRGLLTAG